MCFPAGKPVCAYQVLLRPEDKNEWVDNANMSFVSMVVTWGFFKSLCKATSGSCFNLKFHFNLKSSERRGL